MTHDPTPAAPARRRLPDYAATGPLHLLMSSMGLNVDDPVDVLLAAAYQLAARLERRIGQWDAEGPRLVGAHASYRLTAGPCSVHLAARVGTYTELQGGAL